MSTVLVSKHKPSIAKQLERTNLLMLVSELFNRILTWIKRSCKTLAVTALTMWPIMVDLLANVSDSDLEIANAFTSRGYFKCPYCFPITRHVPVQYILYSNGLFSNNN